MEWILILMLTGMNGVHAHHIPGFKSENACQLAGLKSQRASSLDKNPVPTFACVER